MKNDKNDKIDKTDKVEKKAAKRAKKRERKEKRYAVLIKYQKPILIVMIALFSAVLLSSSAISIVDIVFSSEKIVIGAPAAMVLRYDKPASKIMKKISSGTMDSDFNLFQQASLPIGNGDMGASIFGEIAAERVVFNEKTLWTGGPNGGDGTINGAPYNGGNITGADSSGKAQSDYYYELQQALLRGDKKASNKLFSKINGDMDNKGSYQCWGNIYLNFGHKNVKNYRRELDIDNAVASVSYTKDGVAYSREYLASNLDNVIAMRFRADSGTLNFTVSFPSMQGASVIAEGCKIISKGTLSDNGLQYYSALEATSDGGAVTAQGGMLKIEGGTEACIYLSAATDYKNDFPVYRTGETSDELARRVEQTVSAATAKGYAKVKASHIADYKSLAGRMFVNLGGKQSNLTTDKLVSRYPTVFLWNSERKYLEQLLYNYGRYLLISSSRENSLLPANLQGVWNASNSPKWSSDYHINVNLQMNYWPTYNTNLAECASPLVDFADNLRKPGRITAKTYTATKDELDRGLADEEYGFIANTESNPFGHTSPGSGKYARALWSPAAVAWLLQNVYEGYEYGCNDTYLQKIYPIMKEAALFFERTMVMDNSTGRLVTAPAYSPENGPITLGNTYEQSLVWQLLTDTAAAAKKLGVDPQKVVVWQDMISKLKPIEIGCSGQIKEWYNETTISSMGTPFHRHTSQLLGLFPGDLINKNTNPEWIKAAKTSLFWRGDLTTGWAMGQRINTYARIGDGNKAYKMIQQLLRRGIYPNLFDTHPPFQIDGNFGYTSGVTEMLMQSNLGYIELLPAIPDKWEKGEVNGMVARGNFVLGFSWGAGAVTKASVTSNVGGGCIVRFSGAGAFRVVDSEGIAVQFTRANLNQISFDTTAGQTYYLVK